MRIIWRTNEPVPLRDIALVCVADGIVGVSFGAIAVAGGLPWWAPVTLSLAVFAGGAQFAAVGVLLAGGPPVAAVAAGAVLNTRLFPYGLALADVLDGPWWRRMIGAHLVTDETAAFALRAGGKAARPAAFWTCGTLLFASWNVSVLSGVLAGSFVRNTNAFGLDAMFPAVLLALALPTLRDGRTRTAAGLGAAVAVALTPVLPAGLPVLAALSGLVTYWRPRGAAAGGAVDGAGGSAAAETGTATATGTRSVSGTGTGTGTGATDAGREVPAGGER